jgi:hypothetical protein
MADTDAVGMHAFLAAHFHALKFLLASRENMKLDTQVSCARHVRAISGYVQAYNKLHLISLH